MLDYHAIKNRNFPENIQEYTARDTMLYALGLGAGNDPLDNARLKYVYEQALVALPTMSVVLGHPGFWINETAMGIDWVRLLHGEQSIRLHKPLAPSATIRAQTRISSIVDKGRGRGALIIQEREIRDHDNGDVLATVTQVMFARGDGGFSETEGNGPRGGDPAPTALPPTPDAEPHATCEVATHPHTALVYRLSGDYNPLHADPAVARAAGFPRPILHGLATYGIAGMAVLRAFCNDDPARFRSMAVRFSSPVFPGETVRTEMWKASDGRVHFRARALGHPHIAPADCAPGRIVLSHGVAEIA